MRVVITASEATPGEILDFESFEGAVRPHRWRVLSVTVDGRVRAELQSRDSVMSNGAGRSTRTPTRRGTGLLAHAPEV